MESLSEDHQCLMDIADKLKSDAAAAKSDAAAALTEKRALQQELESMEKKLEEKERESQRGPDAASPNRVVILEQVVLRWWS